MEITQFMNALEEKEEKLRKVIDAHQQSLLKFKIEDQHIIGGKDDCEECTEVKKVYQEILDFETEIFGFNRVQGHMTNIIKLIIKVNEMQKEEKSTNADYE